MVLGLFSFALITSLVILPAPTLEAGEIDQTESISVPEEPEQIEIPLAKASSTPKTSTYVLVVLDTMSLELHDGSTTVAIMPIISKGKPESYYETLGGIYSSDYKMLLHFSSIGHVYMPHSIHIFGNFFIHGIPYHPNGDKVSSDYSGGCIRLSDENAKRVYDFVEQGTPIIITKQKLTESNTQVSARDMTRLMVATISLEFLKQDNPILFNAKMTTRRALLKELLLGNTGVAELFARSVGKETFIEIMNKKAVAIGLQSTIFTSVESPANTTNKDSSIFYNYLINYKSYLLATSTTAN